MNIGQHRVRLKIRETTISLLFMKLMLIYLPAVSLYLPRFSASQVKALTLHLLSIERQQVEELRKVPEAVLVQMVVVMLSAERAKRKIAREAFAQGRV